MGDLDLTTLWPMLSAAGSMGCILYVIYQQAYEVWVPKDYLTKLRWLLLILPVIAFIATAPVVAYNTHRLFHIENETLRNVASQTGNTSRLATGILLVTIWRYRRKEDE